MAVGILWVFTVLAILIGVGMVIGGVASGIAAQRRAPHETATATGTVTTAGHCATKNSTNGHAVFTVAGSHYSAEVGCATRVGQQVAVKYDPVDPSHNNDQQNYSGSYLTAGIGVAVLAAGGRGAWAIRRERRRSRPPVAVAGSD